MEIVQTNCVDLLNRKIGKDSPEREQTILYLKLMYKCISSPFLLLFQLT